MARLISHGFELNSVTNGVELITNTGSPTISSSTMRSGTYAGRISSLSSATAKGFSLRFATGLSDINVFARVYIRFTTLPSAENDFFRLLTDLTGPFAAVTIDNTGLLKFYTYSSTRTQVTGTTTISTDTWYRLEVQANTKPANGSEVATARIDGVDFATATNLTYSNRQPNYVQIGGNLAAEAQTTGDWFFDDIGINDDSDPGNGEQMTWPGDEKLLYLRPNAAGDNNTWTTLAGGAASTNNYLQVDDITPDDGTTGLRSRTTDEIDDYNLEDSGIGASDTINVVHVNIRLNRSSGTTSSAAVARFKAASGGTVAESGVETASSTTWRTNDADTNNAHLHILTVYKKPGTTDPITQSDIDQSQAGVRCSTGSGDRYFQNTALWVIVGYTPNAGGAGVGDDWPAFQQRGFMNPRLSG